MKRICGIICQLLGILTFCLITACAQLERRRDFEAMNPSSGKANKSRYSDKAKYDESQLKEEFGWQDLYLLSDDQQKSLDLRRELRAQESRLVTQSEKAQYYRLKGQLKDDRERIEFLSQPGLGAREQWASNRGYLSDEEGFSDELADLIEKKDISLKMPQKAVLESWGDPEAIEVAGNPIFGFERWRYTRFESSDQGFKRVERLVYFESGVVVGWETIAHQ